MSNFDDQLRNVFRNTDKSQVSIEKAANYILKNFSSNENIISNVWSSEVKSASPEKKLILLYIANHVIQNSLSTNKKLFKEMQNLIQSSIEYFNEKSILANVYRVFHIWTQRKIFALDFIDNLRDKIDNHSTTSFKPPELTTDFSLENQRFIELFEQFPKTFDHDQSKLENIKSFINQSRMDLTNSKDSKTVESITKQVEVNNNMVKKNIDLLEEKISIIETYLTFINNLHEYKKHSLSSLKNDIQTFRSKQDELSKIVSFVKEKIENKRIKESKEKEISSIQDGVYNCTTQQIPSSLPPWVIPNMEFFNPLLIQQNPYIPSLTNPMLDFNRSLVPNPQVPFQPNNPNEKTYINNNNNNPSYYNQNQMITSPANNLSNPSNNLSIPFINPNMYGMENTLSNPVAYPYNMVNYMPNMHMNSYLPNDSNQYPINLQHQSSDSNDHTKKSQHSHRKAPNNFPYKKL